MSIETHVESLANKHAEIEETISREEHRPVPDTMKLSQLKKKKLRIKEEMASLMTRH
ncbi:hypothetical protein GCM10017044_13830 [Kordiimonas sediminis]|uniref:DUF465 domain-containing protein n=2 Tax=Kordiimonas sediminis TaxID=1735581 RepID=A0A919AR09_9PROT|nr:hypothetical protein GCM10017044_13830 [Kordiimonas sediminis]